MKIADSVGPTSHGGKEGTRTVAAYVFQHDAWSSRMMRARAMWRTARVLALLLPLACAPAHAQLRGHGGPVRAVAIAPDGETAISGSFDSSAIRWSLKRNAALQVL